MLVGTVHRDPHGFRKLRRLLEELEPDLLLLELSPLGKCYRQRHGRRLFATFHRNLRRAAESCGIPFPRARLHPQILAVGRQLGLPFEYRAAARHVRRADLPPVVLVDDSRFSSHCIRSWSNLVSKTNLVQLLQLPRIQVDVEAQYRKAAGRIFPTEENSLPRSTYCRAGDPDAWEQREMTLSRTILEALGSFSARRPVYIGGWRHLTPGRTQPTVRTLLNVPSERCILLPSRLQTGSSGFPPNRRGFPLDGKFPDEAGILQQE